MRLKNYKQQLRAFLCYLVIRIVSTVLAERHYGLWDCVVSY